MGTKETRNSVLTVGHSTRTLEEFIHLLQAHGVNLIVDVRTVPRSKCTPQFSVRPSGIAEDGFGFVETKPYRHTDLLSVKSG